MEDSFRDALIELNSRYKNIVILCARNSVSSGLRGDLLRVFSNRYIEFEGSVSQLLGQAVGFSVTGKLPLVIGHFDSIVGEGGEVFRDYIVGSNANVKFFALGGDVHQAVLNAFPHLVIDQPSTSSEMVIVTQRLVNEFGPFLIRV